jgi:hypothetical protein
MKNLTNAFLPVSSRTMFLTTLTIIPMLNACGSQDSRTDASVSTAVIANDTTLSAGVVNANYSDTLAAATSQGTSTTTLALDDRAGTRPGERDDDKSEVTRTCTVDGGKAVVMVTGSIERDQSMTSPNGLRTMERSMKGESTMKRTWTRTTGVPVACNSAGNAAQIDWTAPDNLKLEAEFERSRERAMKITTRRIEKDFSESFKSTGTRVITWGATSTASDTATSYFRTHTASWEAEREMGIKNEAGVKKELKLSIATKEDAPVVVKVERLVADNTVASKTFVSGSVVATKKSADGTAEGTIETSYDNLKVALSDHECALESGSATIAFKDATGVALKTYELSVDTDGEPQLKNGDGKAVEGFDLDGCDPEDLKL